MHGHVARKRFGQNFLADPHYTARIVDAVAPQPGENVVTDGQLRLLPGSKISVKPPATAPSAPK